MSSARDQMRRGGACACGAPLRTSAMRCRKCASEAGPTLSRRPNEQASGASSSTVSTPRRGHDFARLSVTSGRDSPRFLEIGDPAQEAVPLGEGDKTSSGGKAPKKVAAASCGQTINWVADSPVPADVSAENLVDFAAKIKSALGGNPHMEASASYSLSTNAKSVVDKADITLTTKIIKPRLGLVRVKGKVKEVMERCVEFIKTHEEKHRDASREVWQQAQCDVLGKTEAEAAKVLEKVRCKNEPKAQEAIDASEGEIQWVSDSTGNTVDFKAAGVTQNYKPKDCK